jgi:hypothetical protein
MASTGASLLVTASWVGSSNPNPEWRALAAITRSVAAPTASPANTRGAGRDTLARPAGASRQYTYGTNARTRRR